MQIYKKINLKLRKNNSGTSLLEISIAIPVLLIILMGTVDLGMALNQYLTITRATYEGLRYGAGLYDNQSGCKGPECEEGSKSTSNLEDMDSRVKQILRRQGYRTASVTVRAYKGEVVQRGIPRQYNILRATIESQFNGLLPMFKLIPIRATITFTDLYKDKLGAGYENLY